MLFLSNFVQKFLTQNRFWNATCDHRWHAEENLLVHHFFVCFTKMYKNNPFSHFSSGPSVGTCDHLHAKFFDLRLNFKLSFEFEPLSFTFLSL